MEAITPTSLSFPTGEPSAVQKSKYVRSQTVLLLYNLYDAEMIATGSIGISGHTIYCKFAFKQTAHMNVVENK